MLERRHVLDEARARQIPLRRTAREFLLDHPLPERLADDDRAVAIAEALLHHVDIRLRCRRSDAVDHVRREGRIGGDPFGQAVSAPCRDRIHDIG